jgi:four helix bundle protein
MDGFRDLRVWQASMDLVELVYQASASFPRHETFGLSSQLRRAAVSVPSNIAEGHTREHLNEYIHHLSMAHASLAEVETQIEIAGRLRYIQAATLETLNREIAALSRQLRALRNALESKRAVRLTQHPTPTTQHP